MFFWHSMARTEAKPSVKSFQEGVRARAAGKRKSENPYCASSESHAEWLEGWMATFDLDEDDDCDSCRDRTQVGDRI